MNIVPPDDELQDGQPWADQRVTAYVLGELDATQRARFEQEMFRDPALAAAVTEARGITAQLKTWFADEPPITLDSSRRESLLHAIMHAQGCAGSATLSDSGPLTPRPGRSHAHALRWLALAASLLLVAGVVGYQLSGGNGGRTQQVALAPPEASDAAAESSVATGESASSELRRGVPEDRGLVGDDQASVGDDPGSVRKESAETQTLGLRVQDELPSVSRFNDESPGAPAELFSRSRPDRLAAEPRMPSAPPVAEQQPLAAPRSDATALETLRAEAGVRLGEGPSLEASSDSDTAARSSGDAGLGDVSTGREIDGAAANDFDAAEPAPRVSRPRARRSAAMEPNFGAVGDGIDAAVDTSSGVDSPQATPRRLPRVSPAQQPLRLEEALLEDEQSGPAVAGDSLDAIDENPFQSVDEHPRSTFPIDVDTAAYAKVRQDLMQAGRMPRRDGVRIEELVNYFEYDYADPPADAPHPLAADIEIAQCPWNTKHRLARIAIQARRVAAGDDTRRVLVERATPTQLVIARDVQVQVEFNSAQVAAYRLIGYENRMLAQDDGNDAQSDREVGAGHSVTAFFELVPRAADAEGLPLVLDQRPATAAGFADSDDVLTVELRYTPVERSGEATAGEPRGGDAESILVEFAANDSGATFSQASTDFRFAALVAAFGLQLQASEHRGAWTLSDVLREATAIDIDQDETRAQWVELVRRAAELQSDEASR